MDPVIINKAPQKQTGGGPVKRRRRRIGQTQQTSVSSQLLGLSLFIMLLAFFIVMNAISTFEETKVHPIMASLESVFAAKISQHDNYMPSVAESPEQSLNEGDTLERIKALFNAQIPGAEIVRSQRNGTMYVKMPWAAFKQAVLEVGQDNAFEKRSAGQPVNDFFKPTLIALVRSDQLGMPYSMDITLNVSKNPSDMQVDEPQKLKQYITEIGQITAMLENDGLPAKLLSAGMQKGEEGTVELFFRIHEPFNPLGMGLEEEVPYDE